MDKHKRHWDILLSLVGAICVYFFARSNLLAEPVLGNIVTLLSIQLAVILLSMIFAASILKPSGLKITLLDRHHKAVENQLYFLIRLLVLCLTTISMLIIGQMFDWTFLATRPNGVIDYNKIYTSITCCVLILCMTRFYHLCRGILSLFELNTEMTSAALIEQNAEKAREKVKLSESKSYKPPSDFGKILSR